MNPSRRNQSHAECPNCSIDMKFLDGFYKAEKIEPHGYIAPVHYYKCPKCGLTFKGND